MDLQQTNKYNQKIIGLDWSSSSDEQKDIEDSIHDFVMLQFLGKRFVELSKNQQLSIKNKIPENLYNFLDYSFVIHRSHLSIVLMGLLENVKTLLKPQTYQQFRKQSQIVILKLDNNDSNQTQLKNQLTILKLIKQHHPQSLFYDYQWKLPVVSQESSTNEQNLHQNKEQNEKNIILFPFQGFTLSSLVNNFSSYFYKISSNSLFKITKQLITQISRLYSLQIVHGDVCPNNILIRLKRQKNVQFFIQEKNKQQNNQNKNQQVHIKTQQQIFAQSQQIQKKLCKNLKEQLKSVVYKLFQFQQSNQQKLESYPQDQESIQLILIDYGNSFRKEQTNINNHPTQTINYRSPQAIYNKGSFPIDVWGIGHILFSILTGLQLISSLSLLQSQINQDDQKLFTDLSQKRLQQIFFSQNQMQFQKFIQTQVQRFSNKKLVNFNKFKEIMMGCLKINPKQRPLIANLLQKINQITKQ